MTTPLCPRCKVPMRLRLTRRSVHLGGPLKRVWACTEVGCDIVCGAHPDGTPMGVPGDHDTRRARQRAHAEFDAWWRSLGISRSEAYAWLQRIMAKSVDDAHIARFTRLECLTLLVRIRKLRGGP